jgi:hypothetical protein
MINGFRLRRGFGLIRLVSPPGSCLSASAVTTSAHFILPLVDCVHHSLFILRPDSADIRSVASSFSPWPPLSGGFCGCLVPAQKATALPCRSCRSRSSPSGTGKSSGRTASSSRCPTAGYCSLNDSVNCRRCDSNEGIAATTREPPQATLQTFVAYATKFCHLLVEQ